MVIIMVDDKDNNTMMKKGAMELVDYAILKSLTFGTWTIMDMVKLLQIRSLVVEKHIYELNKVGFVDFQLQQFIITSKGKDTVFSFEKDNPINVWKPVDDFIMHSIENRKNEKIRFYKIVDFTLLIIMAFLIILIIYYVIYK